MVFGQRLVGQHLKEILLVCISEEYGTKESPITI